MTNEEIEKNLNEIIAKLKKLDKDHEEHIGGSESADIAEALLILERIWIPKSKT